MLLLLHASQSFVLNGVNSSRNLLPGTAHRWSVPTMTADTTGLGGGLAWVIDESFCDHLLAQFPERTVMRGIELRSLDFLGCNDIKAALLRGFATWSDNHRLISFTDISRSAPCATHSSNPDDACPWELYITTDDGSQYPNLAAYVFTHRSSSTDPLWYARPMLDASGVQSYGVDAHQRSVMSFQTHLCWYLDATFCYYFQRWANDDSVDADMLVRLALFTIFGLAAVRLLFVLFFVGVALFCVSGEAIEKVQRRGQCSQSCSAVLDYLSSLSPGGNVLVLFCLLFPPIFYDRIYLPCVECYDFEAAMAHETGHVLGFGHPDQRPQENLVAGDSCAVNNVTCRDAFSCATHRPYEASDASIMHSLTRHSPRTCLADSDLHGVHFLYPLCDELLPATVACTKARQLSGWLRLAVVVGVPFLFASLLILLPLTCLRWRDQRRMKQLTLAVGTAQEEIQQYQQTVAMLRSAVRDSVRPMTAALRNRLPERPGTASLRRAVSSRRVAPVEARTCNAPPGAAASSAAAPRRKGRGKKDPADNLKLEDVAEDTGAEVVQGAVVSKVVVKVPPPPLGVPGGAAPPPAARGKRTKKEAQAQPDHSPNLNGYKGPVWPSS